jgi:hypothetical protein
MRHSSQRANQQKKGIGLLQSHLLKRPKMEFSETDQ